VRWNAKDSSSAAKMLNAAPSEPPGCWPRSRLAGGELAHGDHLGPGGPGFHPPGGADDPDQLVIRQGRESLAVLAGDGVHRGG
jgi:hypothetical protein